MKRRWAVALLVAVLVAPALAQVRGVPASITSLAPNRSFTPGIPASITSLGPNGFGGPCSTPGALIPSAMGCNNPLFTNQLFGVPANSFRRPIHHGVRGSLPVFVPYPYPVVVQEPVVEEQAQEQEEPPAPTIFEHRLRSAPVVVIRPEPRRDEQPPAPAAQPREPEPDQPAVLLIFRDGHEREVKNYAIVGATLFDLGMFVAGKIPLAELDLKATIKANEDRGIDFTLPSSVKVE